MKSKTRRSATTGERVPERIKEKREALEKKRREAWAPAFAGETLMETGDDHKKEWGGKTTRKRVPGR